MYKPNIRIVMEGFLYTWHVAIGQKPFLIPYIETLNLQIYFSSFSIPFYTQQTLIYIKKFNSAFFHLM